MVESHPHHASSKLIFGRPIPSIYIIIAINTRYLLWNRGLWRSLNNTYPTFLTPCIRCTNHLCDSCGLTGVNPHFIPPLLQMIQNVVTSSIQEPAASHCDVTMTDCFHVVSMDAFLAQWCWLQWCSEFVKTLLCQVFKPKNSSRHIGRPRTLLALIPLFKLFCFFRDPRVLTRGIASILYFVFVLT